MPAIRQAMNHSRRLPHRTAINEAARLDQQRNGDTDSHRAQGSQDEEADCPPADAAQTGPAAARQNTTNDGRQHQRHDKELDRQQEQPPR